MGRYVTLKTSDITPREAPVNCREHELSYFCKLIHAHLHGLDIYPAVVKQTPAGNYVVDGHHRLLVADLFLGESEVWVPDYKDDSFTPDYPDLHDAVRKAFDAQIERLYAVADITTHLSSPLNFADIRQLEPLWFLKTIDSAKQFYAGRKRHS